MSDLTPEQENAVAWLRLTDDELVERSACLGLPGDLHPDPNIGTKATPDQIVEARAAADEHARFWTDDSFVTAWTAANRNAT